jgi:hypothetical protein
MAKMRDCEIWYEMARRKVQFHPNENWQDIELWGLFSWGNVSKLLKTGELITNGYTKENKTIWVHPNEQAYNDHIKPILAKGYSLNELSQLAGWDI